MAMFEDAATAGSWDSLTHRLRHEGVLERWRRLEPTLGGLKDLEELCRRLSAGSDRSQADLLLGALVRLAAVDGRDDADAVLVLLHLLSDGAEALAGRFKDLTSDPLGLVVGELTVQIRSFPWRRRTRAYAANLLLDTKKALWRELRPHRSCSFPCAGEVLVDPTDVVKVAALLDTAADGPETDGDLQLIDVFRWAEATGIVEARDLDLLMRLELARDTGGNVQVEVAYASGMSERTLRRRRDHALAALRAAGSHYLRDCA
jgi:hypothetical protein